MPPGSARNHELAVRRDCAIRYAVRDMGNGVDRIDAVTIVPLDQALIEASLPDRKNVTVENCPRLSGLADVVIKDMGYTLHDTGQCVLVGFVRPIDDQTIEMMFWCRE